MKVHSVLLSQAVENSERRGNVQLLSQARIKRRARELVLLDGPFTESKESCPHVAILALRMKNMGSRTDLDREVG
jgi:hypothetical protein